MPRSPSGASARPSPRVLIKSLERNALHTSRIRDMVRLNGNRSNGTYATEVANKLRARDIPFIFVTGYDRPAGLRYQGVTVLHKPFTQIELRTALISLLNK